MRYCNWVESRALALDGRGPELQAVHWCVRGTLISAIDYYNPADVYDAANLKHVFFRAPQVVMITPEEVIGRSQTAHGLIRDCPPASMFDLGQTEWLNSFSPRHLAACSHFQLLFYEELFDVICEGTECRPGGFPAEEAG